MFQSIPLDQIIPGNNPRKEFDQKAIEELAESIKIYEVIQPITVVPWLAGKYKLVCGERRWRASQLAGKPDIPSHIREDLTDEQAFELSITENLQRRDVHPLDEAAAYKTYQDMKKVGIEELAAKFAKSKEYIAQRLSFNALIPELKKDFHSGALLVGHAVLLSRLQPDDQKLVLTRCKNNHHKKDPWYDNVGDMKDVIEDEVMNMLTHAAFDKKDPKLIPKAGACVNCQKRSGGGLLFGDIQQKDRCFDRMCYSKKSKAHTFQQIDELVVSANPMPVVAGYNLRNIDADVKKKLSESRIKILEEGTDYSATTKKATDSTLALCVAGVDAGRIVGIKLRDTKAAKDAKAAAPTGTAEDNIKALKAEIAGIEERQKRAKELDEEKVQRRLSADLFDRKPFLEYDEKGELHAIEEAAGMFLLYEMLHSEEKAIVARQLGIKVDKRYGGLWVETTPELLKAFIAAPATVYRFILLAAIRVKMAGDSVLPGQPYGILVRKIAESYPVPIAQFEAEQATLAQKRVENANKRKAKLQKKIDAISGKEKDKSNNKPGAIAKGIASLLEKPNQSNVIEDNDPLGIADDDPDD